MVAPAEVFLPVVKINLQQLFFRSILQVFISALADVGNGNTGNDFSFFGLPNMAVISKPLRFFFLYFHSPLQAYFTENTEIFNLRRFQPRNMVEHLHKILCKYRFQLVFYQFVYNISGNLVFLSYSCYRIPMKKVFCIRIIFNVYFIQKVITHSSPLCANYTPIPAI